MISRGFFLPGLFKIFWPPAVIYTQYTNQLFFVYSIGNYTCDCNKGWTGWLCNEDLDECLVDPSPCLNGGSCSQNENIPGNYTCQCTSQFKGHNCEQRNNRTCADNPCLNNAEACLDKQSKYNVNIFFYYGKMQIFFP